MLRRLARFARDTRGAVAPLFAVSLVALIGVGALAWDVSRGYALRTELEAAVDAAALAGATQLDGQDDSIDRATDAALGVLLELENANKLGDNYEANTVNEDDDIRFLTNLTGPRDDSETTAITSDPTEARFIEITLEPRSLGFVLGTILGGGSFNARAHAVAGYGAAICKVPPLLMCNPDETDLVKSFDANDHIGQGVVLKSQPGNFWGPGNFGYLSVTGEDGIKEAMGRVTPLIQCFGAAVETKPGFISSADHYYNTRFDYYQGSANRLDDDPDYMPSQNTITGRGNGCEPAAPVYNRCSTTDPDPTSMSLPRDCCAYSGGSSPTCTGPENNAFGNGEWESAKYFRVNHKTATLPVNWNAYGPAPVAGIPAPTRYQVYNWENAAINAKLELGTPYPSGMFTNVARDEQNPTCFDDDDAPVRQTTPDRRTISVVVANCKSINMNGKTDLAVIAYVDIFLTEPVQTIGPNRLGIYGEIIGQTTDTSTVGQETKRYVVRLYE